ncbi:MAG: DUF4199 domain-containing protein [Chitinophagaceae bacterium]|nr:DUF4199 domain-containing protein [Chitinophagaceae bacterium]
MKLSPAIKAVITASIMIAIALITYYSGLPANSPFQYLIYAVYALGITWTVVAYRNAESFTGKFGGLFNQGFKCFIVVTLLMVAFTGIFSKMHPEFAEESAKLYKEELVLNAKDKTPSDIEEDVARYKKGYTLALIYGSIFGYLIIGAAVTAVTSLLLTRRK